ncbi:MAG: hypothetical protein HOP30_20030 [Cyclobacteriaceae bacterium]|nr:hypothetical protein [Cyclobacteriaceae bacterium]
MKKKRINRLDFIIDKLTNSIENVKTGDSFKTEVSLLTKDDINLITKKNGWLFDWKKEFKGVEKEVYKLTIAGSTNIQGLISISFRDDHVYMHLIESAPFNKGKEKAYFGVPGNLVAFACRVSFQRGGGGYLSFNSKTKLIDHYIKTLGAVHFGGSLMVITSETSLKLINKYFND